MADFIDEDKQLEIKKWIERQGAPDETPATPPEMDE
jgi:hypothetical protein